MCHHSVCNRRRAVGGVSIARRDRRAGQQREPDRHRDLGRWWERRIRRRPVGPKGYAPGERRDTIRSRSGGVCHEIDLHPDRDDAESRRDRQCRCCGFLRACAELGRPDRFDLEIHDLRRGCECHSHEQQERDQDQTSGSNAFHCLVPLLGEGENPAGRAELNAIF